MAACLNPPERLSDVVKARLYDAFDYPVQLMVGPAFALLVFDFDAKQYLTSPLESWTRCAASVGWNGILPADRAYETGSTGAITSMVALLSSPIWKLLEQGLCDTDPNIPVNGNIHLGCVGKREWCRLCDSAGIPHGLDAVMHIAKAVIAAQVSVCWKGHSDASVTPEAVAAGRRAAEKILSGGSAAQSEPRPTSIMKAAKSWLARLTTWKAHRCQLISDGVIADGKFARDHVFSTASGAASCILGSSVNGNAVWKPA